MVSRSLLTQEINKLSEIFGGREVSKNKLEGYFIVLERYSDSDLKIAITKTLEADRSTIPAPGTLLKYIRDEIDSNKPKRSSINQALTNKETWKVWLNFEYQSYFTEEDGTRKQGAKLDNCPACEGLGFIPTKVKRNLYNQQSIYEEGLACPVCLTAYVYISSV